MLTRIGVDVNLPHVAGQQETQDSPEMVGVGVRDDYQADLFDSALFERLQEDVARGGIEDADTARIDEDGAIELNRFAVGKNELPLGSGRR